MLRFGISKFDNRTYVVIDRQLNRELCVCSYYNGGRDFRNRAKSIASALNASIIELKQTAEGKVALRA